MYVYKSILCLYVGDTLCWWFTSIFHRWFTKLSAAPWSIAGVFSRIPLLDADQGHRMTLSSRRWWSCEIAGTMEPWRGRKFEITRLAEFLGFMLAMWEISDIQRLLFTSGPNVEVLRNGSREDLLFWCWFLRDGLVFLSSRSVHFPVIVKCCHTI